MPRKLDRASTSPSTVVTVKSGAAWPTSGPTLSDGVEVGSGTGVAVSTGAGDAGASVLAVVSSGSSVTSIGFDCIELSGVESPPTEGTGVSVGEEVIAGLETVDSVSSVLLVSPQAARNTPSRQVEMSRPDFRYMVMLAPLSPPFKGQCGMSHKNGAAGPSQWSVEGQRCYSVLRIGFRFNRQRHLLWDISPNPPKDVLGDSP